jgi:hypothetical protein
MSTPGENSNADNGTAEEKKADNNALSSSDADAGKATKSEEMKELLAHQAEIAGWLDKINNRVFELEDKYLVETLHGNIIKGWEADGKLLPRVNKVVEDKDRMFTYSSVNAWASYPVFKEKRQMKVENKQRKHAKRPTASLSEKYNRKHGLGINSGTSTDKFDDFDDSEYY